MPIGLKGNTDGSGAIQVGGSDAITISTGLVATGAAGNLMLISGTAVTTTSGTAFDYTNIPSWVKRITIMFDGVSLSGTDNILVQIGDSGGLETTSYVSGCGVARDAAASIGGTSTSGFIIFQGTGATNFFYGSMRIECLTGNTWVASTSGTVGVSGSPSATGVSGAGSKTLSATLDRVSITRTGTNTFDAGSINILYE